MPPHEQQSPWLMREMFRTIAPRYDFISRVFSYGMDRRWKKSAVESAPLPQDAIVLDLASGTGDFSQIILDRLPRARAIAADLSDAMLHVARKRGVKEIVCADAGALPFDDDSFDCVL